MFLFVDGLLDLGYSDCSMHEDISPSNNVNGVGRYETSSQNIHCFAMVAVTHADTSGYHPDTLSLMYPDGIRLYPCVSGCIRIHGDTWGYIRIPSGYIYDHVSGWYPHVSGVASIYEPIE